MPPESPVAWVEVCFECQNLEMSPRDPKSSYEDMLAALYDLCEELKLPLVDYTFREAEANNCRQKPGNRDVDQGANSLGRPIHPPASARARAINAG